MTTTHYTPTQPYRTEEPRESRVMRFPTSPWTEAYQAAPCQSPAEANRDMQPMYAADNELQPTRDALSDIYNRGYSD